MNRTQIYLEEELVNDLKQIFKKELKKYKQNSIKDFLNNLNLLKSFKNINPIEYVDNIRSKSRIVNEL